MISGPLYVGKRFSTVGYGSDFVCEFPKVETPQIELSNALNGARS